VSFGGITHSPDGLWTDETPRALYTAQFGFAVWAMLPNKELDMYETDDDEEYGVPAQKDKGVAVEMHPTPPNQQVPFTPRTQAFHTLDRKLPLRYS
jgi:hypothetical protein